MNKQKQMAFKTFNVDFDSIIELCSGFEDYFKKYPEKEKYFPRCNAYNGHKSHSCTKSRKMFIGKKTECFEKLLKIICIDVDSKFLESEYYFTQCGEGNIYSYVNGDYAIYFDFYVEPTAQTEVCAISVLYPKEKEQEVVNAITDIHNNCMYVEKKLYSDDLTQFMIRNKKRIIDCNNKIYKAFAVVKNKYF